MATTKAAPSGGHQITWVPALLVATAMLVSGGCAQPEETAQEPRPPVEARVAVDKAVATTGDVITYSVEIETAPGMSVSIPEPGAQIAGFRIIDLGRDPDRKRGERTISRRWYRLRADLVGSYILPPIQVATTSDDGTTGTLETSEIFVEVQSVLPADGAAQDIRDVKPLRDPPPTPIWPWVLLAAAAAALLGLWVWWRARRKRAEVERRVPAHELAYQELDRLRRTNFDDLVELREYYFQISEVLRRYVEGRWGLNATDLTTEEILPRLVELQGLGADQEQGFERFLLATDQVKYAAQVPGEREIEETYELALGFVESTAWKPEDQEESADSEVARSTELREGSSEVAAIEHGRERPAEPHEAQGEESVVAGAAPSEPPRAVPGGASASVLGDDGERKAGGVS